MEAECPISDIPGTRAALFLSGEGRAPPISSFQKKKLLFRSFL
jgi:hypothetical protein